MVECAVAVVGTAANETNGKLVTAWRGLGLDVRLMSARDALAFLVPGDVALGRLDVRPTLDGAEPGLFDLLRLERRGIRVLNGAFALLGTHDKRRTARLVARAGIPQPRWTHVTQQSAQVELATPVVVKPRFGSWGRDVFRCDSQPELRSCLHSIADRPWFRRQGAFVQELVPSPGYDLRVVVVAGTILGAVERRPRGGEWRTNVSLGADKRRTRPDRLAASLAVDAAASVGADLVGVDLLPQEDGGYTVIELNGAVDFDSTYSFDGDVYTRAAAVLGLIRSTRQSR